MFGLFLCKVLFHNSRLNIRENNPTMRGFPLSKHLATEGRKNSPVVRMEGEWKEKRKKIGRQNFGREMTKVNDMQYWHINISGVKRGEWKRPGQWTSWSPPTAWAYSRITEDFSRITCFMNKARSQILKAESVSWTRCLPIFHRWRPLCLA